MIVLGWLASPPTHLKPFVRHRVSEIQSATAGNVWRYVPSKLNPADLASRGVSADILSTSKLWWSGPPYLLGDEKQWPDMLDKSEKMNQLPETVHTLHAVTDSQITSQVIKLHNYSNLTKLQHIIAYTQRFIHNCKSSVLNRVHGKLTRWELNNALNTILRLSQRESFSEEFKLLQMGKQLPSKNRLISLSPFIDSNGIIRVGGRLNNSNYDYNVKHPILLSSKHHICKLIFEMTHKQTFHSGPQLLLATMRHNYWPLGGRNLAKKVVRSCIKCCRFKGKTIQPVMGNLPAERVQLEFPFLHTGTDYAGPIMIANRKGRGCSLVKCYICVFVCLATRAVHLELVSDLTKEAFIAALSRFISRRGRPKTFFSDNGTTFVGTFNELSDLLQKELSVTTLEQNINFSFIPAYSPHFGGLWESAVKSIKHHLRRILGLAHLHLKKCQLV